MIKLSVTLIVHIACSWLVAPSAALREVAAAAPAANDDADATLPRPPHHPRDDVDYAFLLEGDYDFDFTPSSSSAAAAAADDDDNTKILRARLQNHVAAQLKKIFSDQQQQQPHNIHCDTNDPTTREQCEPSSSPGVDFDWRILEAEQVPTYYNNGINQNNGNRKNNNLLELKIDVDTLPSELADFVLNHENVLVHKEDYTHADNIDDDDTYDFKIRRDNNDDDNSRRIEVDENDELLPAPHHPHGSTYEGDEANVVVDDLLPRDGTRNAQNSIIDENKRKYSASSSPAPPPPPPDVAPCPIGTYSVAKPTTTTTTTTTSTSEEAGGEDVDYYDLDYNNDEYIATTTQNDCIPCPEGTTTLRVGSTTCQVVTVHDLLGMLYDLASGKKTRVKYYILLVAALSIAS